MGEIILKSSELKGFSALAVERKGSLLSKIFRLSDIDVKAANFHYWRQKNLLGSIEDGKRTSLNLVECIWIKMLVTLKTFGCSGKTMELVHKVLFADAYKDNLSEKFNKSNIEFYNKQEKVRPLTPDELYNRQVLINTANDKLLTHYFRREISYLYNMILKILEYNGEAGILIHEDGTCERFYTYPEESFDKTSINEGSPHIRIPISGYLREFILQDEKTESLSKNGILNEDEYRVIREMRNNNIRSLKIFFRHSEHAIEKLEIEEKGLMSMEKSKEVMELLGMKNYNSVELNTRDGKSLSFSRIEKKFI